MLMTSVQLIVSSEKPLERTKKKKELPVQPK
jgi:hypothetical protein